MVEEMKYRIIVVEEMKAPEITTYQNRNSEYRNDRENKAERTQPERTYRSNESRNNNFNRQPQRQNSRVERPHMEQRQVRTQQTRQVERNTTPQRQSVRTQPQQTRKVERSHQPQRKSSEVTQTAVLKGLKEEIMEKEMPEEVANNIMIC